MGLGGLVLGSPILYPNGHEDTDVPTFWLLLYDSLPQILFSLSRPGYVIVFFRYRCFTFCVVGVFWFRGSRVSSLWVSFEPFF